MKRSALGLAFVLLLLSSTGCGFMSRNIVIPALVPSMNQMLDVANGEADVQLVRDALPSNLLMIDGLVAMAPDNDDLKVLAAQGYCSYALAFIMDEDKTRAAGLFHKGRDYALEVLFKDEAFKKAYEIPNQENPADALLVKVRDQEGKETGEEKGVLLDYGKDKVPALFWAGNCVAGWVQMTGGKPEAVAELPAVEQIMNRLLKLDETYYMGGPHLFWGIYLASKPTLAGGNPAEALKHFNKVFEITKDKFLLAKVFFAQYYARAVMDRELFEKTLKYVLETPSDVMPEQMLANQVAKKKAVALLPMADEWF